MSMEKWKEFHQNGVSEREGEYRPCRGDNLPPFFASHWEK